MTRGLKKSFKEDNIIKQTEVMAAMSEWWHEGFWRKHYDKTYEGSSDGEENYDEEVNDEEASEQEANNCPPPPKKKKSEGESKKKKKVQVRVSEGRGRSKEGVGGSLFDLMVIYFDLNLLNVKIGKEPQPPITLWMKKLMEI
ncbi:hypothetical protein RHGRI_001553 [Rhododendron griersonianum]|uniref:Uncharacterized protein n=1 Tax=Rhododendron griersonianum TaxID=479676 RepID=A0AAV6LKL8_9ERIC|nr:hypothetical protein RHGRI_001553 [Rhododendron griersonianum]